MRNKCLIYCVYNKQQEMSDLFVCLLEFLSYMFFLCMSVDVCMYTYLDYQVPIIGKVYMKLLLQYHVYYQLQTPFFCWRFVKCRRLILTKTLNASILHTEKSHISRKHVICAIFFARLSNIRTVPISLNHDKKGQGRTLLYSKDGSIMEIRLFLVKGFIVTRFLKLE